MRWGAVIRGVAAAALLACGLMPTPGRAATTAPHRPGPSILYAPPAAAPQLENAPPWRAAPLMVSGASAYREGEFLYQDFLFDDLGAGSTLTYPNDPAYAGDAADIVEVRIKLLANATAFRITYNAMEDPSKVAATIALGTSGQPRQMPFGANTAAPAAVFVTAADGNGRATDAASGRLLPGKVTVSTNLRRKQVDVRIPFSAFDPRGRQQRVALASGLWDSVNGSYLQPQASADSSHPGGASTANPSAFFNVAFRYAEPFFAAATARDRLGWHESQQSAALASGNLADLAASIDFRKLAAGTTDEMRGRVGGTPVTGHLALIYASHFNAAQGRGVSTNPCVQPCDRAPEYPGQLQPYAAYVPTGPPPHNGWGMTLFLHACGVNYTPGDSVVMAGVGNRSPASIVISPNARGTCEWYWGMAGADVFEAWGDARRRWPLDPRNAAVYGVSMGGYGTYKLATTYPDLFARAAPVIGCVAANTQWAGDPVAPSSGAGTSVIPIVASLRHVPLRSYAEVADSICTVPSQNQVKEQLDAHGYRYQWVHAVGAHTGGGVTFSTIGQFFGSARVDPDPPHVTYALSKAMDQPTFGLNLDGAYWVSGIRLKDASGPAPVGVVDARSDGFGISEPASTVADPQPGVEGQYQPYPNVTESRVWGPAARVRKADVLHLTLTNVRSVVIDLQRAHLSCHATVQIATDTAVEVRLAGCGRTVRGRPS